jgi:hypothetical protein
MNEMTSQTRSQATAKPSSLLSPGILQRQCACGNHTAGGGTCEECSSKDQSLQRKTAEASGSGYLSTSSGLPLQRKLTISASDDLLEKEADRVADQVMSMRANPATSSAPARIQRFTEQRSGQVGTVPPSVNRTLSVPGRPLERGLRQNMESRFGRDFSHVRVHTGATAEQSAKDVNANAYTVGDNVVFASGRFKPDTYEGGRLLAHELAHVVQQTAGRPAGAIESNNHSSSFLFPQPNPSYAAVPLSHLTWPTVMREQATTAGSPASTEFLQEGWVDINELGLVYREGPVGEGGGNLRETPDGKVLTWLPQNTHVFILKHNPKRRWYAVSIIDKRGGSFGYIADWLIVRGLPDPEAEVLKIHPGDSPIDIAKHFYAAKGFNVWGKDARYVVNALVWVNQRSKHNFPGEVGLSKADISDTWFTAKATSGVYIWLPGTAFLTSIYEQIVKEGGGTGSISADLWKSIKKLGEYAAYGLAFVGGLMHGFVKSLWDAAAGLVKMIADVLVSIFTGEILSDAKRLWQTISKMTWKDIKEAVGAWADNWEKQLNSDSPWTSGHAHGYLVGYIMAEAAQLLLTAGTLAAAKGALWGSRLGKAIQATRGFKAFVRGMEALDEVRTALKATKTFTALNAAREWAMRALKLSIEFVKDLSLDAINRLGQLPEAIWKRLSRLSEPSKRVLFRCASPCTPDTDAIKKLFESLSNEEIEHALAPLGAATGAAEQEAIAITRVEKAGRPGAVTKAVTALPKIPVEDVVQEAMMILKKQGVRGLHPREYGTKLAATVKNILIRQAGVVPPGWIVGAEKRLGEVIKLTASNAKLTVKEYMTKWGMAERYPQFSEKFLSTRIEDLKPDLFVRASNGRALVWDVTSQPEMRHVAKTMFYSEVIGRETNSFLRISESYWKKVF